MAVVLFSGLINYLSNEDFALNELRNRFINKADFLKEFKALCETGFLMNLQKLKLKMKFLNLAVINLCTFNF